MRGPGREAGITTSVQGPLTVTLTDETPATGQTTPQGTVDAVNGIHGHRVNHTIRMRISITDATGLAPTYPVLVHLALAGTNPGTLILDPDGTILHCSTASFIWHERDAQGNIINLNEEFEYTLGTLGLLVGVTPDPNNAGSILPVWGSTEALSLSAGTLDSAPSGQFSALYAAHPEAGAPTALIWSPKGQQPANQLSFQSTFGADFAAGTNSGAFENLYYLTDSYGNQGMYAGVSTSATNPASDISAQFQPQVQSASTDTDAWGFTFGLNWTNNPSWPSGTYSSTLTASGTDPETGPYSLDRSLTAIFSTQSFYAITYYQGYDAPYDLPFQTVNGSTVNLTQVSPGSARLALDGNPLRTTILLLTGTKLASLQGDTDGEPVPEGQTGDPMLYTGGGETFDVRLVDSKGHTITDGSFGATLCPYYDHTQTFVGSTTPFSGSCPSDLVSANGLIAGLQPNHGYIGLTISKAPANPGDYFFIVTPESGNQFSWTTPNSGNSGFIGFVACTVTGGEILDQNFQIVTGTLPIVQPTSIYVRYSLPRLIGSSVTADLLTTDSAGNAVGTLTGVSLTRVAESSDFISEAVVLNPPQDAYSGPVTPSATPLPQSLSGVGSRLAAGSQTQELTAASGLGRIAATQNSSTASAATLTDLVFDFRIGTLQTWIEPNLLFGDGLEYLDMAVRPTDAAGNPLPSNLQISGLAAPGQGTVAIANANPDPNGWIYFRYTAPSLTLGSNSYLRPLFTFTITSPGGPAFTTKPQSARLIGPWNCQRTTDSEPNSHCFGDPNFPIVSSQYDFRNLTYYGSTGSAALSDQTYLDDLAMDEDGIASFLRGYHSQLLNLYFVASGSDMDNLDTTSNAIYESGSGGGWPAVYLNLDGTGRYNAATDWYLSPNAENPGPTNGFQGISFAHVLWAWCNDVGLNPKVILTHIQVEESLVQNTSPDVLKSAIGSLLNVSPGNPSFAWPSVQMSAGVEKSRSFYDAAPGSLPVGGTPIPPHSGVMPQRVRAYRRSAKSNDPDDRFTIVTTPAPDATTDVPTALFVNTRSAFALFTYTNQVNSGPLGGGNYLFMQKWYQFGFGN